MARFQGADPVGEGLPTGDSPGSAVPHGQGPGRTALIWLIFGNAVAALLIVVLSLLGLHSSHSAHRQRALDAGANIAAGVEQSLVSSIGRIDMALQTVAFAYERGSARGQVDPDALKEQQTLVDEAASLRVADANGTARHGVGINEDPRLDLGSRDFFVRARDDPVRELIVSGPLVSRVDGAWVMVLARRLNHPDGSFAGVVYASVATRHFESLLSEVHVGRLGAISLRSASLQLVARYAGNGEQAAGIGSDTVSPQMREALGRQPESGTYIARTALDQVERANAYRRVGKYPLLLVVGLSTDEYFASWRGEVAMAATLALLAILALGSSAFFVSRAWKGEQLSNRALAREGHRNRALMLTASDGLHVLDRDGKVVELSASFAAMLGYPRDRVIGMHVSAWDARFDLATLGRTVREFAVGQRLEFSTRYRHRDGHFVDADVVAVGVRIDGEELLYCSARDVSARRRAERALRASQAFLDQTGRVARIGGWQMELDSGEIVWSDQTCRIHDVEPGLRPTLEQVLAFYPPEARAAAEQALNDGVNTGLPWDIGMPLVTAKGRHIWIRAFGQVEHEDGKAVRLVGAIQDITESQQRKAELERERSLRAELERHTRELDALLRERSEMLDVMAHEVRQPLNNASAALQGAAAVLADVREPEASSRLTLAQTVLGQVLAHIDNTLAVASLLARPEPIEPGDSDIDTLIAVAVADLPAGERARIRIERATATRTVPLDMSLMRLALRNLLSNAVKYSPAGSPVTVTLSDSDEPLALVIDVTDVGPGLEPDLVPRLFERGARGKASGASGGHGLGLYIVQRVMELHGGAVEVVSSSPAGVTMRLLVTMSADDA